MNHDTDLEFWLLSFFSFRDLLELIGHGELFNWDAKITTPESRAMHPPTGRRILRSSPSLSSLASSLSSVSSSLYTTTSSRTQWGPGALTGKAILALGKATLRGAERVVIFRRMATIKAHLPYYDNDGVRGTARGFMDGIFDDLLELSR